MKGIHHNTKSSVTWVTRHNPSWTVVSAFVLQVPQLSSLDPIRLRSVVGGPGNEVLFPNGY